MANPQESHNQGQADGSKADLFDQFCENWNIFRNDPDYTAGYSNGVANPSSDDSDDSDDE